MFPPSLVLQIPSNRFLWGVITTYSDSNCRSSNGTWNLEQARVYTSGSQSEATALCMAGHNDGYEWIADASAVTNFWRCRALNPTSTPTPTPPTPTYTPTPAITTPTNVSAVVSSSGTGIVVTWDPPPAVTQGYRIEVTDPSNKVSETGFGSTSSYGDSNLEDEWTRYWTRFEISDSSIISESGTYTVRVRFKRYTLRPYYGEWSEAATVTLSLPANFVTTTPVPPDTALVVLVEPSVTAPQQQQVVVPTEPTAIVGSDATDTPVPPTDTPVPTATDTPVPTATHTPAPVANSRAVTNVQLASNQAGKLSISWNAPAEAPHDYRVMYAPIDESYKTWSDPSGNAFPTDTSITLSSLDQGVSYKVRVRARYNGSSGPLYR